MLFHTTKISRNSKTGPMPVITSSRETCPDSCPLKTSGCYAMTGPLKLHWDKVTSGQRGTDLDEALKPIRRLNHGALWRYGQAGDLPGRGEEIDREAMMKIARASRGKRGIVFTHKPPTPENVAILKEVGEIGLNVNLSADNIVEADELADHGLPVVTVLPTDYGRGENEPLADYRKRLKSLTRFTPGGRKIAICPATYVDTSCTECGVCADGKRNNVVVGFPAHGTQKKQVNKVARINDEVRIDRSG